MTAVRRSAATLVLVALTTAGCTGEPTVQRGPTTVSSSSSAAADPGTVADAVAFGAIVLPPGAEVLAADTESRIDTFYRLSVRTDPAGRDALLTASGVTGAPSRFVPTSPGIAAGPPLANDPAVTSIRDTARSSDGAQVSRIVIVDARDPAAVYVHLQLFTT